MFISLCHDLCSQTFIDIFTKHMSHATNIEWRYCDVKILWAHERNSINQMIFWLVLRSFSLWTWFLSVVNLGKTFASPLQLFSNPRPVWHMSDVGVLYVNNFESFLLSTWQKENLFMHDWELSAFELSWNIYLLNCMILCFKIQYTFVSIYLVFDSNLLPSIYSMKA